MGFINDACDVLFIIQFKFISNVTNTFIPKPTAQNNKVWMRKCLLRLRKAILTSPT